MEPSLVTQTPTEPAPGSTPTPVSAPTSTPLCDLGKVWLNGQIVPAEQATVSVMDHGVLYGDGVFEGIRSYAGKILKLKTHLDRFFESAKSIRMGLPYSADQLADAIRATLAANGRADGYIRLAATRGVGSMGLNPFLSPTPSVFVITCELKMYPQELYDNGMKVITSSVIRNHPAALSPRIKSNNYLNNILAKIEAIDAGCLEAVMLNTQGNVAECTGDNIFIAKHGKLYTPPLHAGILEGITRNIVIDLARKHGLGVVETDITKHDLYTADEMLLTGTGAEVIAVTEIDGRKIGYGDQEGKPGPLTLKLNKAFRGMLADGAPED
ncbi:MAG: branched-chain-amino-acid transaminase [Phycisphaeraceae bacterium]|nr:branched-chain-amino-acid transaminase [Phycisphaeraceae bacterium]